MSVDILAVKLEALHGDVGEIKSALSELSKAITKLAVVEQQQSQNAAALERAFSALDKLELRIAALEKTQPQQTEIAKWVDRALLALAGAAAALIYKAMGTV